MTDVEEITAPVDGRVARRERNVNAVLDCVIEMIGEDAMFPTIEQASKRSGLSLRSIYRYFADPGELLEGVIRRNREIAADIGYLPAIGQGDLEARIESFVKVRLALYDAFGAVYRASVHNAAQRPRLQIELTRSRSDLCDQFERQFAPELASRGRVEREALLATGDVLTQLDAVDMLRRYRGLSPAKAAHALTVALHALFA